MQVYSNVEFLEPLVKVMTARDPRARPTAAEAFSQWKNIRERIGRFQHFQRLVPRHEHALIGTILGTVTIFHTIYGYIMSYFSSTHL